MKTPLTIEELKNRVGKPVFLAKYNEISNRVDLRWVIFKSLNQEILELTEGVEDLKIGDNICFFDTEVSEEELKQYIETELKEILEVEEKKKKTGYERVEIEKDYYTITSTKDVTNMREYDVFNANNEKRYKNGNYFDDEALAENIARAERLKYQLRRYAALNGGIPSKDDWNDCKIFKYFVVCNYRKNEIHATYISTQRDSFQIYFKDIKACKKAIETFKDELVWYFTEFEEMLY